MTNITKLDALFFGAHPDDIELCCGGTFIKMIKNNYKAGIIDLTNAELSSRGTKQIRQVETNKATEILGAAIRENAGLRDGDIVNDENNRNKIIFYIRKYQPEIIFLPYYKDRHPDHVHTSILVKEASFYSGLEKIKIKVDLPPFRPKKNIYYMQTSLFEPSFIIDISETFEDKMNAVMCYKTQFYSTENLEGPKTFISDKRFLDYVKARAVFYGFQIRKDYGEPFYSEDTIESDVDVLFNSSNHR